jgi:hypothetical protein
MHISYTADNQGGLAYADATVVRGIRAGWLADRPDQMAPVCSFFCPFWPSWHC